MLKSKALFSLAVAVALPLALEVIEPSAAAELSPPPSPAVPQVTPLDATLPLLIEAGGDRDFVDGKGQTWLADVGFIGGSIVDRGDVEIDGTSEDRIYQTERWGLNGYAVKVPNGKYTVRLHFAETFLDTAGKRIFSVNAENRAINDLDVFAAAGGKNKALVKTLNDVTVSDGELNIDFSGATAIINGIEVAPVASAEPPVVTLDGASVPENAPAGRRIGTVKAESAGGNESFRFALRDDAQGRFVIDAESGELSVAADAVLDYEAAASHQIIVTVTDGQGETTEARFTITVLDVAEPTGGLQLTHFLPENAAAGTTVGIVAPTDPQASAATYALKDDASGRFVIDATSGKVSVADDADLDFETAAAHTITVAATPKAGGGVEQSFVVALEDVNEAPSAIVMSSQSVADNAAAGTVVGVASTVDPDAAETFAYSLENDADGRFVIDAGTGTVSVAANAKLNRKVAPTHRITIEVTDSAGHSRSEGFTIAVKSSAAAAKPTYIEAGADSDYVDAQGHRWLADTGFVGGQTVDRGVIEIAGTDNDRIYQTERWGLSAYSLPLATGTYTVKLHFAETLDQVNAAGKRVFSLNVEGNALNDLDVYAEAGSRTALVKTVPNVSVTDGHLDIAFEQKVGQPIINAIEVEPVASCADADL
jgi:hypothetical protein